MKIGMVRVWVLVVNLLVWVWLFGVDLWVLCVLLVLVIDG